MPVRVSSAEAGSASVNDQAKQRPEELTVGVALADDLDLDTVRTKLVES